MWRVTPILGVLGGTSVPGRRRQIPALAVRAAGSTDACQADALPGSGSGWAGGFVVLSLGLRHRNSWRDRDQGLNTSW